MGILLCASAPDGSHVVAATEVQDSPFCGRVVSLTCAGTRSDARLVVEVANGDYREFIIPEQLRPDVTRQLGELPSGRAVCGLRSERPAARASAVTLHAGELIVKDDLPRGIENRAAVFTTCDPSVQPPVVIREVRPSYSLEATRAAVSGDVLLHAVVDERGQVADVRIIRSLSPSLDAEVQKAFRQWHFVPATRMGTPVVVAVTGEFQFRFQ